MSASTMGERIKYVRNKHGLTQQAFAERIGISRGALANYEVDRNEPIDAVIKSICREFHVNANWLRTGVKSDEAETTQQEKIANFFTDVLSTAPDERSALIAALDDIPPEFWPMVAKLARDITANLKKEEG